MNSLAYKSSQSRAMRFVRVRLTLVSKEIKYHWVGQRIITEKEKQEGQNEKKNTKAIEYGAFIFMIIYHQPPRHVKSCKIYILLTIYTSVNDGVMGKALFVDVFTIEEPVSIIDYFMYERSVYKFRWNWKESFSLFTLIGRESQQGKYYFSYW